MTRRARQQMRAAMRDLETLHSNAVTQTSADARGPLTHLLTEAQERRAKLERQLAMADQFIDQLSSQLS